jgi:D-glycerate 3-kinase
MRVLGMKAVGFLNDFIKQEQLPLSYDETVRRFYGPAAQRIRALIRQSDHVPVIGINGAQGTGKSTVSACMAGLLEQQGLRVLVLSIDDLYYTRADRERLAAEVHPLLITRGVPGTHDMELGRNIIATARGESDHPIAEVPRFDKGADDRCASGTPFPPEGVDVVLFEGWCIGALPQPPEALAQPCNGLEQAHDPEAVWRTYVNDALKGIYADVFAALDYLIMLKPPSFDVVYTWRGEQEEKLRQRLHAKGIADSSAMDEAGLAYFISHYERLTRWMFQEMPDRADEVFWIGEDHEVFAQAQNEADAFRWMVSTDLDATLLDGAYSWAPAKPALLRLAEQNACVVLNSSKTVREMLHLAGELIAECGLLPAPLVAENGGVLALPDPSAESGYRIECLGMDRKTILACAHRLRNEQRYAFEGFADLLPEDVMRLTGLSFEAARMAMDRQATEPILWKGSEGEWIGFSAALAEAGIRAVRGGRFIHLMGPADKADGQHAALEFCQRHYPASRWRVIALGDSPNDQAMLDAAEVAVVIDNPAHEAALKPRALLCVFPPNEGPVAWNQAVLDILKESE